MKLFGNVSNPETSYMMIMMYEDEDDDEDVDFTYFFVLKSNRLTKYLFDEVF